ncbi:MAG: hypothetical protein HAW60_05460 [Bdellovibrionales bacterium]|nr:hypothetical protein [Bdellovibrionales bacterium]
MYIFRTISKISCKNVAEGYKILIKSPLYIANDVADIEFFNSEKIEPFIADNIFKHLDPNKLFFTSTEIIELKKTQQNNIIKQLLSGNCSWYHGIFKKYESSKLKLSTWYQKDILSKKSNNFIYTFINFFTTNKILSIERLLQKPWAKISLNDIKNLKDFSFLGEINNKEFEVMKVIRGEYNLFLKNNNNKHDKNFILNKTVKHIYDVAINSGAVYNDKDKNHVFLSAIVNSLDPHSFYKKNDEIFMRIENNVDESKKLSRFQSKLLNNNIAYIKFSHFYNPGFLDNSISEDFIQSLKKLDSKSSSLIIDIRDNLGGSIDEVIRMLGSLIYTSKLAGSKSCGQSKSKKIKDTPYDNAGVAKLKEPDQKELLYAPMIGFNKAEKTFKSLLFFCNRKPYFDKKPIVVLINKASASSAEILALGLQEAGIAIVVGSSNSFGKGTSQSNYDNLRLTDLFWTSVLGTSIQKSGITSDIVLKFPLALKSKYYKFLITEKNLPRALSKPLNVASAWSNSKNESNILSYFSAKKLSQKKLIKFLNQQIKKRNTKNTAILSKNKKEQEKLMFKEIFQILKDWKKYKN